MYNGIRQQGFTLIELMTVLAIAAVLLAVAAPGFKNLLERNRLQSAANNLYTSLMLARSEALKRNQAVQLCKGTSTGSAASCTSGTSGEWEGGWIVHLDANNPTSFSDPNDVLVVRDGLKSGDTLRASGNVNSVSFRPDGSINPATNFVLCNADADTNTARVIEVSVTGRPRVSVSAASCDPS